MKQIELVDSIMAEVEGSVSPEELRHKIDCLVNQYTREVAEGVAGTIRIAVGTMAKTVVETIKQF